MLSLVYAKGRRPSVEALAQLSQVADATMPFSISHRGEDKRHWAELLAQGLTFDCVGLAPGPADKLPPVGALLGLDIKPQGETISLRPGPHLAEGRALAPVVRALAGLGARLSELPDILSVCWRPARSWMAPGYYRKITQDWLAGGPFPALGFTTLHRGGDGAMVSKGLDYFIGQELRFEPGHGLEPVIVARIAVRMMNDLIATGPLRSGVALTGPEGERLHAEPRPDGAMINVKVNA